MFGSDAERPINIRKLNPVTVKKFQSNPGLIALLDAWVLVPNNDHLPDLIKAAETVRRIQPPQLPHKLFRGFSVSSSYQDHMGLVDKGWFSNSIKKEVVNKPQQYALTRPVSFTTNLGIAKAFGDTIITIPSISVIDHCIWLSDELSYVIALHRNLKKPMTQDEVVVLPSVKTITITVLPYDAPSSKW